MASPLPLYFEGMAVYVDTSGHLYVRSGGVRAHLRTATHRKLQRGQIRTALVDGRTIIKSSVDNEPIATHEEKAVTDEGADVAPPAQSDYFTEHPLAPVVALFMNESRLPSAERPSDSPLPLDPEFPDRGKEEGARPGQPEMGGSPRDEEKISYSASVKGETAYIVGHAGGADGQVSIESDRIIYMYAKEGGNVPLAISPRILKGEVEPVEIIKKRIYNYELEPIDAILIEILKKNCADAHFVGFGKLEGGEIHLCDAPEECQKRGEHECGGVLGRVRAKNLRLIICRGDERGASSGFKALSEDEADFNRQVVSLEKSAVLKPEDAIVFLKEQNVSTRERYLLYGSYLRRIMEIAESGRPLLPSWEVEVTGGEKVHAQYVDYHERLAKYRDLGAEDYSPTPPNSAFECCTFIEEALVFREKDAVEAAIYNCGEVLRELSERAGESLDEEDDYFEDKDLTRALKSLMESLNEWLEMNTS
ncbi:hypothetical protein [Streptomyces sp. NPDC055085]